MMSGVYLGGADKGRWTLISGQWDGGCSSLTTTGRP